LSLFKGGNDIVNMSLLEEEKKHRENGTDKSDSCAVFMLHSSLLFILV
jgi:hypothetical protein